MAENLQHGDDVADELDAPALWIAADVMAPILRTPRDFV
jgi:hypothetical protein